MSDQYCFLTEWYDAQASLNRQYTLLYGISDGSIELFDVKTRRAFLKRSKIDTVNLADLFIGNTVTILSRSMKIVDYGDAYTRRNLTNNHQKATGVLLQSQLSKIGQVLNSLYEQGVKVSRMRQVRLSSQEVYQILDAMRDNPNFNAVVKALSDDRILVIELLGSDVAPKWSTAVGYTELTFDSQVLERLNAGVLQSRRFGRNTAVFNDSTCCILKPHLVSAGMAGAAIYEIQKAGIDVSGILSVNMTKPNAEEFLEVYKGVVQEYPEMVDELTSGTAIVLELNASQAAVREFVGPHDPEIARTLRPKTLRALFGLDKVRNGIHCTDLPEDAALEVEYFFRILDN